MHAIYFGYFIPLSKITPITENIGLYSEFGV